MYLPKKDLIATVLVATAGVLYLLWATEVALPGLSGTRATGMVILVLGFAGSASAVVPGFGQLVHGNKVYLAVTSLIGLGALIAAVLMLATGSDTALVVVMAAMVLLWLIATIHHSVLAKTAATAHGREAAARSAGPLTMKLVASDFAEAVRQRGLTLTRRLPAPPVVGGGKDAVVGGDVPSSGYGVERLRPAGNCAGESPWPARTGADQHLSVGTDAHELAGLGPIHEH